LEFTKSFYLFILLPVILLSGFYTTNTILTDANFSLLNRVDAQLTSQTPLIEILSTLSYIDDFGNLHVIGEVNNTSFAPQTNVIVGALFFNLTTNDLVGNYSAFTSLETLRPGELSPYHIVINDPQVLGSSIEFFTSSQSGQAKPPNLVVNVTSTFIDEMGNPHIAGNIINQGFLPESFANLIATYYDNSSLGVIGADTFGIDLGNISQGQMTQFDLGIADNRTKNQAQFFSLNAESNESSMDFPLNVKRSLYATFDGEFANAATSGLFGDPLIDLNQGFSSNSFDNNVGQPFSPSLNSASGSGSSNNDISSTSENRNLDIEIDIEENLLVRGNDQTIDVTVSDSDTSEGIEGAEVETRVLYASKDTVKRDNDQTDNEGKYSYTWKVGPNSDPGNFEVTITADAEGYNRESEQANFEVIRADDEQSNNTQINTTDVENVEDNGLSEQQETQQPPEEDTPTNEVSDTETSSEDENGDDSINNGNNNEGSDGDSSNGNGDNNGDGGDEGSSNNNDDDDSGNGDEGGNGEEEN
jgi:hypothetical protein